MVPKHGAFAGNDGRSFRAVLFRMVPKLVYQELEQSLRFRAVLFRMVPKKRLGQKDFDFRNSLL